ncbi:hypothetical protein MPSEU_000724200 [Mayamaea pseudoterrestris]|nr:hypothetical protein MPSEU_000724200 [Mayamaea pseudoterrestris]
MATSNGTFLALAPALNGVLLPPNRKKPRPNQNALVVLTSSERHDQDFIFGRYELRLAHWQSCLCFGDFGTKRICAFERRDSSVFASDEGDQGKDASYSQRSKSSAFCERCERPWTKHIPKKFLKVSGCNKTKDERIDGVAVPLFIHARGDGTYPVMDKMQLNGKNLCDYGFDKSSGRTAKDFWAGPLLIQEGDSINFRPICDDELPLEFLVVAHQNGRRLPETKATTIVHQITDKPIDESEQKGCALPMSPDDTESPLRTQAYDEKWPIRPASESRFPHLFQSSESLEHDRAEEKEEVMLQQLLPLEDSPLLFTPPIAAMAKTAMLVGEMPAKPAQQNNLFDGQSTADEHEDCRKVRKSPFDKVLTTMQIPASLEQVVGIATVSVDENVVTSDSKRETESADTKAAGPKLYFVSCNRHADMFNKQIRERARRKAIARGATIMDTFDRLNPPNYLIVGNSLRMDEGELINEDLKFYSVQDLHQYMEQHGVVLARLKWVMKADDLERFGPVTGDETYRLALHSRKSLSKQPEAGVESPHKRQRGIPLDSQITERKNSDLADLFTELSELYRDAPMDDQDLWRAYTFNKAASVMRHLTFDVTFENVDDLKDQYGLKGSCVDIAKEYVTTGGCLRRQSLIADRDRAAIRDFTGIWGVGPKRAKELLSLGYHDIESLRTATELGKLMWQRNEYLGLKYYEDINEEMDRDEATHIVKIVTTVANSDQFYPSAQVHAMGSYRRMKPTNGDVDFIITDPAWLNEVPPTFLGQLVDKLHDDEFILHHLTLIRGMNPDRFETLEPSEKKFIKPLASVSSTKRKDKRSYTWMGIFKSPTISGKVRRVDIKVYPYSEFVYASLYFTGNGHFNRAMRFWSKKMMGYRLDDHGLWMLDGSGKLRLDDAGYAIRAKEPDGSIFRPTTEKDVFDKLGLVWREPHERDGFAALQSKDDKEQMDLSVNMGDIMSDTREYTWVA